MYVLAAAALVLPPLVFLLVTGFEAYLFLVAVGVLAFAVAFLWGVLIAPLANSVLLNRQIVAERKTREWLRAHVAPVSSGG